MDLGALHGRGLLLTSKGFAVLEALALRQNEYIPSAGLYEAVWGP